MSALYASSVPQSALAVPPAYINPSQMQTAQAGPSSSQTQQKKKSTQSAKRKRTDTDDAASSTDTTQPARKPRDGPKKKKANRACFHCQKAHLTCDDSRPCQRCIKRGIASNCTEGHRKKAKYLLDDDELEQLKQTKSPATRASTQPPPAESPAPAVQASDPFSPGPPTSDPMLSTTFDPTAYAFGSEAANLEYSILSAILGNPSPPETINSPPPTSSSNFPWPADTLDFAQSPRMAYAAAFGDSSIGLHSSDTSLATSPASSAQYLTYPYPPRPEDGDLPYPTPLQSAQSPSPLHPLQPRYPLDSRPRSPPNAPPFNPLRDASSRGLLSPPPSNDSPASTPASVPPANDPPLTRSQSSLQSINDRVTVPYDYTEGYHFLMKHLPTRFEKNDILRIVRALAIFRPSLIALQMPLSLDDEIFVEKCFQRSLLELDKLISYSGTPTVVWRRTGEICLVAPEFCMLTEWPMEELIGRKKYIYELFENQSVVEYWENFASHAFENTTQSVYSHCVLLKPSGAPVPSTFCFSIRRDLFDLPSIVIGQWLPLL
ncbi:hypothetical protein BDN72DRAFT_886655 [Pluteus cervinus]|uniref:Uncharacterized protein n=1 Tax=Pluteus cervinus TaxID=181527 RepID=A0ACD3B7L8_9AGAR|nr:hypothetical protein BDN72DRAFT_886655 [Pluteus cervinus]